MDAGELVIKTVMNNDKFEKQYKQLENRYKNKQIDLVVTTGVLQKEQDELERLNKEGEKLQVTYNRIKKEKQQWETKKLEVSTEISPNTFQVHDYNTYNEAIKNVQNLSNEESKILDAIIKTNDETIKQEQIVERINAKYEKQKNDLEEIKRKTSEIQLKDAQEGMEKFGKVINGAVKSIGRMGLALLGIRGLYTGIRKAISDLSVGNQDIANTLTFARTMLATALEPVIIRIVDWIKQLMIYLNYLFKAWFKRDLFAETNKNLKNANKSASALKKTLAGFDEMNILNSSSSGGGGGVTSADLKIPDLNGEVPEWLKAVETTGKWILDNWQDVVFGITLIKMAIDAITGNWLGFIIDSVILVAVAINQIVDAFNGERASIKSVEQAEKDLNTTRQKLKNARKEHNDLVNKSKELNEKLAKAQKETGITGEELYEQVLYGKKNYDELSPRLKNLYDLYVETKNIQTQLADKKQEINNLTKQEIEDDLELELSNAKVSDSYDKLKEKVEAAFRSGKMSAGQARDYLERAMGDMSDASKKTFLEDLPNDIKAGLDPNQYDSWGKKLSRWWNKLIGGLDTTIELTGVAKGGGGKGSSGSGGGAGGRGAKGLIYYDRLPKLAVGGIVNQPGRGIPYRGATIGERGAEAVVPLTDSQQMELLGQAIGRYITINNTNPIYMNGRLIAKEINRSNAEDDFAFNR